MTEKKWQQIWQQSLEDMKQSLIGTYKIRTSAMEHEKFVTAWNATQPEYVVFSDYQRNEGARRVNDIEELIDDAIERLDSADPKTASEIYLRTLKSVTSHWNLCRLLENRDCKDSAE